MSLSGISAPLAQASTNYFLSCPLIADVASAVGFRFSEIKTEILLSKTASEFSDKLGREQTCSFGECAIGSPVVGGGESTA
jgi:hypothetical protein